MLCIYAHKTFQKIHFAEQAIQMKMQDTPYIKSNSNTYCINKILL